MRYAFTAISFVIACAANAQDLSPSGRDSAAVRALDLMRTEYVFDSIGNRCAAALEQAIKTDPTWKQILTRDSLASFVTTKLRKCTSDEHVEVQVASAVSPAPASAAPRAERSVQEALRLRNFDVPLVRKLPGNVGYIDLRSFPPVEWAGETVAGAMAMVQNSDALIIDLRRNSGGTGDMVRFIATWFFDSPTVIANTYRRAGNSLTPDRTLPYVPGKRMPRIPLFILTSHGTFSAAESFAFSLQQIGRAKVVGERTRGGANAGRYRTIGYGMSLFVPQANTRAANSDKTYDRIGVMPDIISPDSATLHTAHIAALRTLLDSTRSDVVRRNEIQWAIERVSAQASGVTLTAKECPRLAQSFEGKRVINCRGRTLWYSRAGGPERVMTPLSSTHFMLDDVDDVILELNEQNGKLMLTIRNADGSVVRAVISDQA